MNHVKAGDPVSPARQHTDGVGRVNRLTIFRSRDAPADLVWQIVDSPGVSPGPGEDDRGGAAGSAGRARPDRGRARDRGAADRARRRNLRPRRGRRGGDTGRGSRAVGEDTRCRASVMRVPGPSSFTGSRISRCDGLVVFGITGDLGRVMTFRSLHGLEQRGVQGRARAGETVVASGCGAVSLSPRGIVPIG